MNAEKVNCVDSQNADERVLISNEKRKNTAILSDIHDLDIANEE